MNPLLDCLVTYSSAGEDADGLPRRYFCYHVVAGPGQGPDGGVAAVTVVAAHDPSRAAGLRQNFHAVRAGGPENALHQALHYLDAFHATDRLHSARSEIRRPPALPVPVAGEVPAESDARVSAGAVLAGMRAGQAVIFLDARSDAARHGSLFRIRGDVRVSPARLPERPDWPRDGLLVVYGAGHGDDDSVLLAQELRSLGYAGAHALAGGFEAWRAAGGPVDPK